MQIELEQTPFLNLLAGDKVRGTLEQMHQPGGSKLVPAIVREVCLHTRSRAFVTGSIADAGNHYPSQFRLWAARPGSALRARSQRLRTAIK